MQIRRMHGHLWLSVAPSGLPGRSWSLWLMRVIVLYPYTKFEVRRPCHSEDMVDDVH